VTSTEPNAHAVSSLPPGTRIAVVVDWLAQFGGAELVIKEILAAFPDADLFALFDVMDPEDRRRLSDRPARTTFLQHLPDIGGRYRSLLPLMPAAVRSFDLSAYDLVISSHHAVAKGIRRRKGQVHVCYCHSPTRYLWDMRDQYLADHGITGVRAAIAHKLLDRLQKQDRSTADGVDVFVVNSRYVADRVRRHYGRESTVVHPPVDTGFFTPSGDPQPDLYVTASRQVPYKRIDRIIAAFRDLPDRRLVVIGDGPQHARLRTEAEGAPNIRLLGAVPREELRDWMRHARAFVFAADEDFGIVPLEAQACGTPVIALGRGGALETVRGEEGPARTGLFFADDDAASIVDAVRRFEALDPAPSSSACWANAATFEPARFRARMVAVVNEAWASRPRP
jgi:glycosyltransferase involved in cell wall biosynthesis